jgi:signal transduction histidine kinase
MRCCSETTVDKMIARSEKVKDIANTADLKSYGPLNVTAELTELVAAKRRVHPEASISVTCPDSVWVAAGPAAITAIDELVTNAIAHHETGTPAVHLEVEPGWGDDQKTVKIRVTDNGPGIPEREINPILQGRETPLDHSSGVGLWLVTWIVRELGGDIEFSGVEDGSAVTIYLPRDEARKPVQTA